MQPKTKPRRKYFNPEPQSLCLCGSGARFANCCRARLPGSSSWNRWRIAAERGRLTDMVRHLRANVTQYTIWHIEHTAPVVAAHPELRNRFLMNIDIEALSDYVASLMWGYARKGWLDRLPTVLDRLKSNIDDPRWLAKIAFHRAMCALWRDDREQAIRELSTLQPITPAGEDVDILQVHVDLHGGNMGMTERLAFFDRIRTMSDSNSDKLQYGGARGFEILLAEDEEGARVAFGEVIALGREIEEQGPLSPAAEIWYCKALEGRAVIDQDIELFNEIDSRLTRQLAASEIWSPSGRANILRILGDSRRYAGAFESAIPPYRESFQLIPAPELRVFEAECELRRGNIDDSFRIIQSISVNLLDLPERADHAFTYFYIALARGNRQSLIDARDLLRAATTPHPYFQTRRLQHIITIADALEALERKKALPELGPILSTLKKVSRYVQLQPNWNGVGINGNAMIDDYVAHAQERLKRQDDDTPTYPAQFGGHDT